MNEKKINKSIRVDSDDNCLFVCLLFVREKKFIHFDSWSIDWSIIDQYFFSVFWFLFFRLPTTIVVVVVDRQLYNLLERLNETSMTKTNVVVVIETNRPKKKCWLNFVVFVSLFVYKKGCFCIHFYPLEFSLFFLLSKWSSTHFVYKNFLFLFGLFFPSLFLRLAHWSLLDNNKHIINI